jgi:hypothetical protein
MTPLKSKEDLKRLTNSNSKNSIMVSYFLPLNIFKALKQWKAKKYHSMNGTVYDPKLGKFVHVEEAMGDLKKRAIDPKFIFKNGSLISRMDTELELFH